MFQRHEIEALLLTREEPLKEHLLYFSNWESKYCVPLRVSEGIFSKLDIKNYSYTLNEFKGTLYLHYSGERYRSVF